MLKPGDIVPCTVTETGSWGAYATSGDGELVFINFGELSWRRINSTTDVVSLGDVVQVKIADSPNENRHAFLGSIKQASPDDNPWADVSLTVGSVHVATISHLSQVGLFCELPTGVVIYVHVPNVMPESSTDTCRRRSLQGRRGQCNLRSGTIVMQDNVRRVPLVISLPVPSEPPTNKTVKPISTSAKRQGATGAGTETPQSTALVADGCHWQAKSASAARSANRLTPASRDQRTTTRQ